MQNGFDLPFMEISILFINPSLMLFVFQFIYYCSISLDNSEIRFSAFF